MATYLRCDECGRTLSPTEKVVTTTEDFWVFPASDAPEGAEEVIETRTVTLCEDDAVAVAS
jgi:hypothetical protein